jgi:hypothetical protein
MPMVPKKKINILVTYLIVLGLLFTGLAFFITKIQTDLEEIPFGSLLIWEIAAAAFSVYALVKPWEWEKKYFSSEAKFKMTPQSINSQLILNCFANFVLPFFMGLILIFWGLSFIHYLFFALASFVDILAWRIYTLRARQGSIVSQ